MNSLLVELVDLVDHVESSQLVPRRLLLSNLQFGAKMAKWRLFQCSAIIVVGVAVHLFGLRT